MIKNIYNKIIVSAIYTIKNSPQGYDIWKLMTWFFMTINFGFNLLTLFLILKSIPGEQITKHFIFDISSNMLWNGRINMMVYLLIPGGIINYFSIVYQRKYEKLMHDYPEANNKKSFRTYTLISWIVVITIFYIYVF